MKHIKLLPLAKIYVSVDLSIKNGSAKMSSNYRRQIIFKLMTLVFIMILPLLLAGCDWDLLGTKKAAKRLEEVATKITNQSDLWREEVDKISTQLPEEVRAQVDLAVERATVAAGAEVKCEIDFIRDRLKQDLNEIAEKIRLGEDPSFTRSPTVCHTIPEVVKLDIDLNYEGDRWVKFAGYDLDGPDVQVLLESKNKDTRDITSCCLDNPTHYSLTVDLDEVIFLPEHRRIVVSWPDAEEDPENTVAINHFVPPPIYDYKIEMRTWDQRAAPAAADGHVWVTLVGSKRSTPETEVPGTYRRGEIESKIIRHEDIGDFRYVKIRYDDGEDNNAWHLDWIHLTNLTTEERLFRSRCDQWYGHQNPLEKTCPSQ